MSVPGCQCLACQQGSAALDGGSSSVSTGAKWGSPTFGTGGGTVTWSYASLNLPGRDYYNLSLSFLPAGFQTEVSRAFAAWESAANIHFQQVADGSSVDIRIGGSTIDGASHVLGIAHWTFSGTQLATADIELDGAENWSLSSSGISLFSVLTHEIGHAIGLAHSGSPAIMEPFNNNYQGLQAIDVGAIRAVYGANPLAATVGVTKFGTAGNDVLIGTSGNNSIYGQAGNDVVVGHGGVDFLRGGLGADRIQGLDGADTVFSDDGKDSVYGGSGGDKLYGGTGDDLIYGEGDGDTIAGGAGNDALYGGQGNDVLVGEAGNDRLDGEDGDDGVNGGIGNDGLIGGEGDDFIVAGAGNDGIFGDMLSGGGTGNDTILGQDGNDVMYGQGGSNSLVGGAGADTLYGHELADRFVYTSVQDSLPTLRDVIGDFSTAQGDKIELTQIDANTGIGGDQAFGSTIGVVFTGTAGQLIFSGGILSGDVNGDGVADFQIQLTGVASVAASDFFL